MNRYALLHPETLWAVSIGAPGSVTLLDPEQDWWVGVRDAQARFGKAVDAEALRKVAVHMIVGKADLETWEITHREGGKFHMPGANSAGLTRPERLESLRRSFEAAGARGAGPGGQRAARRPEVRAAGAGFPGRHAAPAAQ